MRIAVDTTCWHNNRGYGRHARALLRALVRLDSSNRYTFCLDAPPGAEALPEGVEVLLADSSAPAAQAASAAGRRSVSDMWRMSRALSGSRFDTVLFPSVYSYVPVVSRARKLVVIHDVIAETFPHLTVPRPAARLFWNAKVAAAIWQSDAIVTVSEYSKRGIVEQLRVPPERIHVVGEANDPVFRRLDNPQLPGRLLTMGLDASRPMAVYVGGFNPHKNLEAFVDAFAAIVARPEFADAQLVLVGEYEKEVFHSYHAVIAAQVERLGLAGRTLFTGFLSDEHLVELLNIATVLVLPSLMEGFGLPAVEAAACGCPVIATTASPLPELLPGAGLFIEPNRPELEEALINILGSAGLRSSMRQAGLAAANRLTWEAAARQMMDVINLTTTESR